MRIHSTHVRNPRGHFFFLMPKMQGEREIFFSNLARLRHAVRGAEGVKVYIVKS